VSRTFLVVFVIGLCETKIHHHLSPDLSYGRICLAHTGAVQPLHNRVHFIHSTKPKNTNLFEIYWIFNILNCLKIFLASFWIWGATNESWGRACAPVPQRRTTPGTHTHTQTHTHTWLRQTGDITVGQSVYPTHCEYWDDICFCVRHICRNVYWCCVLQAAAQTPMLSAGDDSVYLDDEFFETAQPTSAKALPSFTAPFSGALASIQEQSSLEDIEYFIHLSLS